MNNHSEPFFQAGGTLPPTIACYVRRDADDELFRALTAGEFCYLLTSRQMGKSSLIFRTRDRLLKAGAQVAFVDLTGIGAVTLTVDQWYYGLAMKIAEELSLVAELDRLWDADASGPSQRFFNFLRQHVVPQSDRPLIIFLDEIDLVSSLTFSTDDFFAGIRECYNRRAMEPAFQRLTFCLSGVASPSDLIRNPRTTPFNIGRRIELRDFTRSEAQLLAGGFPQNGREVVDRVLHWTGGQPYLTQRLCQEVAEVSKSTGETPSATLVDRACRGRYFSEGAREKNDHLAFVAKRIVGDPREPSNERDVAALLDMYRRVLRGRAVPDEPTAAVTQLKLSGIVRSEHGRLRVANRIYASSFDRHWIRSSLPGAEKRRRRKAFRKGLVRASLAAAIIMAVSGWMVFFVWDKYFRVKVAYFNTYVRRWGVPEGIGPLTEEAVRHRAGSFAFYTRAGWVEAVEAVDADFEPTSDIEIAPYIDDNLDDSLIATSARPVRWEFVRDVGRFTSHTDSPDTIRRNLIAEVAKDRNGKAVWTFVYAPTQDLAQVVGHYIDDSGHVETRSPSTAEYVHIKRNSAGLDQQIIYQAESGELAPMQAGYADCGEQREHDERGLVFQLKELALPRTDGDPPTFDPHGEPESFTWFDGCRGERRVFDDLGNIVERTCFDTDGRQNRRHDGSGRVKKTYDTWGRQIAEMNCDEHGRPMFINTGYAGWEAAYDDQGRETERRYVDAQGQLTWTKEGYAIARTEYSADGYRTTTRYFGVDNQPVYHAGGYAEVVEERAAETDAVVKDRRADVGDIIAHSYFGPGGFAVLLTDGYHRVEYSYGDSRLEESRKYFGRDGSPVLTDEGYSQVRREFNDAGYQVSERYLGVSGNAVRNRDGIAGWTAELDERGNRLRTVYQDESGKSVLNQHGYAAIERKYDESGKIIEERFLDQTGALTKSKEWDCAIRELAYVYGQKVSQKLLAPPSESFAGPSRANDQELSPEIDDNAHYLSWSETESLDNKGIQTREIFKFKNGAIRYVIESTHNDFGHVIEERRFRAYSDVWSSQLDNLPANADFGLESDYDASSGDLSGWANASWSADVDQWGRPTRIRRLIQERDQIVPAEYQLIQYDVCGREISRSFVDRDGSPRNSTDYARRTIEYDSQGRVTAVAFFDITGSPVPVTAQFGGDGAPIAEAEETSATVWERPGPPRPLPIVSGITAVHRRYSADGRLEQESFSRSADETEGTSFVTRNITCDAAGFVADEQFLAADGRPATGPLGYARRTQRNTDWGTVQEIRFLDADGELVLADSAGFARAEFAWNGRHLKTREAFFDESDQLLPRWSEPEQFEYAAAEWKYDDSGSVQQLSMQAMADDGWYTEIYDDQGHVREFNREDNDRQPVNFPYWGYARRVTEFKNIAGARLPVKATFFDAAGARTSSLDRIVGGGDGAPYFQQSWDYDQQGRLTELRFEDGAGLPVVVRIAAAEIDRPIAGMREIRAAIELDGLELSRWTRSFGDDGSKIVRYGRAIQECSEANQGSDVELLAEAWFDSEGRPAARADQYDSAVSRVEREYDAARPGLLVRERYFDKTNKLVLGNEGYAAREQEWNNDGRLTRLSYHDVHNEFKLNNDGYAMVRRSYTDGRLTREEFSGTRGEPVITVDGFTSRTLEYEDGQCVSETFFGMEGEPKAVEGYARVRWSYDERGNLTGEEFQDAEGNLAMCPDGFARMTQAFTEAGLCSERVFIDADGAPVAVLNRIETELLDQAPDFLSSRWSAEYDPAGRLISERFQTATGESSPLGFAAVSYTYGPDGALHEIEFRDAAGELVDVSLQPRELICSGWRWAFPGGEPERLAWRSAVRRATAMPTIIPAEVHACLERMDPLLYEQIRQPAACRLTWNQNGSRPELNVYQSDVDGGTSPAFVVRDQVSAEPRTFAWAAPPLTQPPDEVSNAASGTFWHLTWLGERFKTDFDTDFTVTASLIATDDSGNAVVTSRGYAQARLRPFDDAERTRFSQESELPEYVVEFFGTDGSEPANYLDLCHRIRVWHTSYYSSSRSVRFFDADDERLQSALRVLAVDEGAPAEDAGFQAGDLLVEINGRDMDSITDEDLSEWESLTGASRVTVRRGPDQLIIQIPYSDLVDSSFGIAVARVWGPDAQENEQILAAHAALIAPEHNPVRNETPDFNSPEVQPAIWDEAGAAREQGEISPAARYGLYRIVPPVDGRYVFVQSSVAGSDLDCLLTLYDVAGVELASNDDGIEGTRDSKLTWCLNQGETYYVKAAAYEGLTGGTTTGTYTLSITPIDRIPIDASVP